MMRYLLILLSVSFCLVSEARKCDKLFDLSLPMLQYQNIFQKIKETVASKSDWTDKEKSEYIRSRAFELEEITKTYKEILKLADAPDAEIDKLKRLRDTFKDELEDTLGKSFEHREISEKLEKLKPIKDKELRHLVSLAIPYLKKKAREDKRTLLDSLQDNGWLDNLVERFDEINAELATIDWPKKKKIVKLFRKMLLDSIEELAERLPKDPENPKEGELRPGVLEAGTHEIRRELRKFSIRFIAMGYFVTYKDSDPNKLSRIFGDPKLLANPFTKQTAEYKNPIEIKRNLILALSRWIDVLGKAKDWGAVERELAHTAVREGIVQSHPAALKYVHALLKDNSSYVDFYTTAVRVVNEVHDTNFLERLAESIEP